MNELLIESAEHWRECPFEGIDGNAIADQMLKALEEEGEDAAIAIDLKATVELLGALFGAPLP